MVDTSIQNQRFGKLIALYPTEKRSGNSVVQHCKCDCGNEKDISRSSLVCGLTKSCGCLHKKKVSNVLKKDIIGQKFGLQTVLEELPERNKNQKIMYRCQCECGTIRNVVGGNLLNHTSQSCGCLKMSHGELKIAQILKDNNIDFIQEYHPKDFEAFQNARYDFYIPSMNLLIEYDGKQHFKERNCGWKEETLVDIQKRDQAKNEYAVEHKISLIRIPYTQYEMLSIEDLNPISSSFILK